MKSFTYCWAFYGSMTIEAENREEADAKFDEIDFEELRDNEDDWELTLVQEEDENGKTTDYRM
jgi:hypothetical protein